MQVSIQLPKNDAYPESGYSHLIQSIRKQSQLKQQYSNKFEQICTQPRNAPWMLRQSCCHKFPTRILNFMTFSLPRKSENCKHFIFQYYLYRIGHKKNTLVHYSLNIQCWRFLIHFLNYHYNISTHSHNSLHLTRGSKVGSRSGSMTQKDPRTVRIRTYQNVLVTTLWNNKQYHYIAY